MDACLFEQIHISTSGIFKGSKGEKVLMRYCRYNDKTHMFEECQLLYDINESDVGSENLTSSTLVYIFLFPFDAKNIYA